MRQPRIPPNRLVRSFRCQRPATSTPPPSGCEGGVRMSRSVRRVLSTGELPRSDGRPSIYDVRCRTPPATYPGARASSPRTHPVWSCSRWGLPSRDSRPPRWWSLTPPFHPYPSEDGRSALCGTFPRVTPGGRYPPPCSTEPGRSSVHQRCNAAARPTHPPGNRTVVRGCARHGVRRRSRRASGARVGATVAARVGAC